jgi:hypothetical protein
MPSQVREVMGGATMVHQVGELERCGNLENVWVLGGLGFRLVGRRRATKTTGKKT